MIFMVFFSCDTGYLDIYIQIIIQEKSKWISIKVINDQSLLNLTILCYLFLKKLQMKLLAKSLGHVYMQNVRKIYSFKKVDNLMFLNIEKQTIYNKHELIWLCKKINIINLADIPVVQKINLEVEVLWAKKLYLIKFEQDFISFWENCLLTFLLGNYLEKMKNFYKSIKVVAIKYLTSYCSCYM